MKFFKKILKKKQKKGESVIQKPSVEEARKAEEDKFKKPTEDIFPDLIIRPLLTEKTKFMAKQGKYTFLVKPSANKSEIKKAIEKLFNVKVNKVNVIKLKRRTRGRTKIPSVRPLMKKALISLKEGSLPFFE